MEKQTHVHRNHTVNNKSYHFVSLWPIRAGQLLLTYTIRKFNLEFKEKKTKLNEASKEKKYKEQG